MLHQTLEAEWLSRVDEAMVALREAASFPALFEGFARLVVGAGRDPDRDELGVSGSEIGRFALALSIILGRPAARPEMVQMW